MREDKPYGKRTQSNTPKSPLKKYFFVFEGEVTERIYFNELKNRRNEIGINPLIELIQLVRCSGEIGWSHPLLITKRIEQQVNEREAGRVSYDSLIISLLELLVADGNIKITYNDLRQKCENDLCFQMNDYVDDINKRTLEILGSLGCDCDVDALSQNIVEEIEINGLTDYETGFDKICIIVDRDKGSFKVDEPTNQYDQVREICQNNGFHLCVTNPCFEFWLLLHFDDHTLLDETQLKENPRIKGKRKRRYVENECIKRMPGFQKTKYNATDLIINLSKAIENEKAYCEDLEGLKSNVGSNLGILFSELFI